MLKKITALFDRGGKEKRAFLEQNQMAWSEELGFIVDGIVLNDTLTERLEYLSNRRLKQFDDLKALYLATMLMNEKIDLEIANQQFNIRVGNTEENLRHFQSILARLGDYYRQFVREK